MNETRGMSRWDRVHFLYSQCGVLSDTKDHKCSYRANCGKSAAKEIEKHFTWQNGARFIIVNTSCMRNVRHSKDRADDGKSLLKALVTDLRIVFLLTRRLDLMLRDIASLLPRSITKCSGNKPKRMKRYVTRFKG